MAGCSRVVKGDLGGAGGLSVLSRDSAKAKGLEFPGQNTGEERAA